MKTINGNNCIPLKTTKLCEDSIQNYQKGLYGVYDAANYSIFPGINLCYRYMDLWKFAGQPTYYMESRFTRKYFIPEEYCKIILN